jgi:uncharacterized membrane protein YkvA (DUF1232 family)
MGSCVCPAGWSKQCSCRDFSSRINRVAKASDMTEATILSRIKTWARTLRRDAHAVLLASRDPRVPWYAKALAIAVAGYALSPIDLIPDFIPVLGYLDDLIIVPLGIWLVIALIPEDVMSEYRAIASAAAERPVSKAGAIVIIAVWILAAVALGWIAYVRWYR